MDGHCNKYASRYGFTLPSNPNPNQIIEMGQEGVSKDKHGIKYLRALENGLIIDT